MIKKRFLSMLVLLAAVVTGAMAQTESLLTTITATGKEQASYSTANVATVSFSYTAYGSSAYLANWGWWGYGWSATVTAAEGYTITKCIFYDDANRIATDSEAPFVVETTEEDKTPQVNGTPILAYTSKGIKKIEVYGYVTPTTVDVTLADGTDDATSWQGKAGTGEYQALPLKRVAVGTAVSVKYNGWKLVKSVKAKKKVKPAAEATAEDKGKLIGADGNIYADVAAATAAGTTAVAKICYVSGSNGLALALADEGQMSWSTAISTCAAHTPAITGGTWKLATKDEWKNMITAAGGHTALRDGFSSVGGSNMHSYSYWSSSEYDPGFPWYYAFGNGGWYGGSPGNDYWVRACLAFGAQGSDPDPIELTSTDGETWTLASMPDYDVELEVEYFNITVPTANTADIYAGTTTPLINAGSTTEDGATMKYLVTATNEQPTSTDGFSAHVPTAQALTAPGTYYVWYYLYFFESGDDSGISALAVEVTVKAYAITMKEGTEDADNWQGKAGEGEYQALPLEGVAAGTAVSVKYSGRKLVKSVKAMNHSANNTWAIAEVPDGGVELEVEYFNITVPTANTADIYASTTPLINAGSTTEDGATMKYLVTATNEQPTSTDGFSADVPTAKGRTPGTYYVWYYLDLESGDDSDISALAVEVTVKAVRTYHVTMKGGIEDATSWQGKAGTGEYQALPLKRVAAGTAVSVKYNGTKLVKSVKGTKKVKPAAEATAEDKGKLIGRDGRIYDTKDDAEDAGTTAVAKIIYIGPTGHATYNHGLALALTDEGWGMKWKAARDACSAKNTSTPVTGATWLLASKDQWDYMIDGAGSYIALRDGFSSVGGSNLHWDNYWSSTEHEDDDYYEAWCYVFDDGHWGYNQLGNNCRVRACLAFGAQETVTLNHSANNTWAQEETLLTTILSTGDNASFKSGSKTFDNKATVTFSGTVYNNDDEWGWWSQEERTLTVTAAENYTITRVKFYTDDGSGFDEEAPFEAILVSEGGDITKVNGTKIGNMGVTKIEVYGYADIVNHSANNTWAIAEMPDGGVELEVEYFNITVPTANTDSYAGTTTPLINAGSTTEDGATMKYLVTATNEQPTSTDGFSTDVPTAQAITGPGTYYVWYYLDLASGADSDISALAVEVTVKAYAITMKEGTLDATSWQGKAGEGEYQALPLEGVAAGTAVSVKYNGTKKVKSVKVMKPYTMAAAATSADKGKLICTSGHIHANGADAACTKARVAKIIYIGTTGHAYNHGLALALTDEGQMAWGAAIDACSAKNTSTPVTNATWLLASKAQWDYMMGADGAGSYTALRDGFSGITGASSLQSDSYWSGTEDGFLAWFYRFDYGRWDYDRKDSYHVRVRACLAF